MKKASASEAWPPRRPQQVVEAGVRREAGGAVRPGGDQDLRALGGDREGEAGLPVAGLHEVRQVGHLAGVIEQIEPRSVGAPDRAGEGRARGELFLAGGDHQRIVERLWRGPVEVHVEAQACRPLLVGEGAEADVDRLALHRLRLAVERVHQRRRLVLGRRDGGDGVVRLESPAAGRCSGRGTTRRPPRRPPGSEARTGRSRASRCRIWASPCPHQGELFRRDVVQLSGEPRSAQRRVVRL